MSRPPGDLLVAALFAREQARVANQIEHLTDDADTVSADTVQGFEMEARFEDLVRLLDDISISDLWPHATVAERRTLLDEVVQHVEVHEDQLSA